MLRRLAPCGSGHRDHTSFAAPERRAALISWGLPRQQGSLLSKVNERTGEWGILLRSPRNGAGELACARLGRCWRGLPPGDMCAGMGPGHEQASWALTHGESGRPRWTGRAYGV